MSDATGIHDFAIPHDVVRPTRDMITIKMPRPPKKIGSIEIPQMFRDVAHHNVMAGRVVAMGPVAFVYKDNTGEYVRQDVKIGDWVIIRPYAGTMVQGGQVQGNGNCRYVSSFQDVIGIIPAEHMPDPDTLIWDDNEAVKKSAPQTKTDFGGELREKITSAR